MPVKYLPGLANVDHVDTVRASLPDVRLHVHLEVLGAQVALSCKQHLNVLGGGIEDRGQVGGSHDGRLIGANDWMTVSPSLSICVGGVKGGRRRGESPFDAADIEEFRLRRCGLGQQRAKTSRIGAQVTGCASPDPG